MNIALTAGDWFVYPEKFFAGKQANPKQKNTIPVKRPSTTIILLSSIPNNNFNTIAGIIINDMPNVNSIKEVKISKFFIQDLIYLKKNSSLV